MQGQAGGESWTAEFDLSTAHDGKGMGVIWARRRVEALMDSIHEGADREEVRQKVVEIALKHHIVTRYTSLVAVDVTPVRPEAEGYDAEPVPANLPDGGSHAGYFGSLPKTATPAELHLILAILAAALGFMVYLARRVS